MRRTYNVEGEGGGELPPIVPQVPVQGYANFLQWGKGCLGGAGGREDWEGGTESTVGQGYE